MANRFDWQSQLSTVYASFPEAQRRPVIGITGNYGEHTCKLADGYYRSVQQAGGVPIIIPPLADTDSIINTLEHIDGLLLSGGADYNPLYAGEEPQPELQGINSERDLPELLITRLAYNRQIPILGICRGIQTLAMALGGKVLQDINLTTIKHSQDADRSEPTHSITVEKDSTLFNIYKSYLSPLTSHHSSLLYVNSFHHQAVGDAGPLFRITATAPDGTIEAIESNEFKSILGVQWHPECLTENGLLLFKWLVNEAALHRDTCDMHSQVLTLDTHCDTPMFFPKGVDFGTRDKQ